MKITSTDHLQQLQDSSKSKPQEADKGFSKLLEETKTQATPKELPSSPTSASALLNSNPLNLIMATQGLGDKATQVDRQMEKTLDNMEQYASALGDTSKSLKDIEHLALGLNQDAARLSKLSQGLPEGHSLKSMSNDTAVLATVESMKFNRGDFI